MGGFFSVFDVSIQHVYTSEPKLKSWKYQFSSLKLNDDDIRKLYSLYIRIRRHYEKFTHSASTNGSIPVDAIVSYFKVEAKTFLYKALSIFNQNEQELFLINDFREFAIAFWNFCSSDDVALISSAYGLYDRHKINTIGKKELLRMVKDIYGECYSTNVVAVKVTETIDRTFNNLHRIDLRAFLAFTKSHPSFFYPVLPIHMKMIRDSFGLAYWKAQQQRRLVIEPKTVRDIFSSINPYIYCRKEGRIREVQRDNAGDGDGDGDGQLDILDDETDEMYTTQPPSITTTPSFSPEKSARVTGSATPKPANVSKTTSVKLIDEGDDMIEDVDAPYGYESRRATVVAKKAQPAASKQVDEWGDEQHMEAVVGQGNTKASKLQKKQLVSVDGAAITGTDKNNNKKKTKTHLSKPKDYPMDY